MGTVKNSIPKQKVTYEVITPDQAYKYLETMPHYRPLRQLKVDDLVRSALDGEFSVNIEPLHFDKQGRLRNGQHRMWMVITTGISQEFMILRNLNERELAALDSGTARTAGDVLAHAGFEFGAVMAQALHALYQFKNGNLPGSYNVNRKILGTQGGLAPLNNNLMIQFANDPAVGPQMQQSVAYIEGQPAFKRLAPRGLWAFTHFIITEVSPTDGDEFFRCVKDAIYKQANADPVYQLRKRLEIARVRNGNMHFKLTKTEQCALIIKAWNMWAIDKSCLALRWSHKGEKQEAFPQPIRGLVHRA
jgi:hypothetical protein